MEKHPVEPELGQPRIEFPIAVAIVTCNRMADVRAVCTDLMSASGLDANLHERGPIAKSLDRPDVTMRGLTTGSNANTRVRRTPIIEQRQIDVAAPTPPTPAQKRHVPFVDRAFAEQLMQHAQRAAALGKEKAARRAAVEPMHELEPARGGPPNAHRLDATQFHAAAAVNGKAGRLVEHNQLLILVNDATLEPIELTGLRIDLDRLGLRNWRDPDSVAASKTVARRNSP